MAQWGKRVTKPFIDSNHQTKIPRKLSEKGQQHSDHKIKSSASWSFFTCRISNLSRNKLGRTVYINFLNLSSLFLGSKKEVPRRQGASDNGFKWCPEVTTKGTSLMYPIHARPLAATWRLKTQLPVSEDIMDDLRYDSWHNSKIAPVASSCSLILIMTHDSKLTYKMICSKHFRAGPEGSVKWQIPSSLHACCHCNAFGPCPSEDIKAFHIHVIDWEPVPFLQAPRTNTNSGMNGFELCVINTINWFVYIYISTKLRPSDVKWFLLRALACSPDMEDVSKVLEIHPVVLKWV